MGMMCCVVVVVWFGVLVMLKGVCGLFKYNVVGLIDGDVMIGLDLFFVWFGCVLLLLSVMVLILFVNGFFVSVGV